MSRLQCLGWKVIAAGNADEHVSTLADAGIPFEEVTIDRSGLAPTKQVSAYRQLRRLYRRHQPDLIHHFQAKPVILGCAAAKSYSQAKVVNTITGLGHAFVAGGFKRWLASAGYRAVLGRAAKTIFQNPDDQRLFIDQRLVHAESSHLIVGSGVNVDQFRPSVIEADKPQKVLMVARLLWEKGVNEFVAAARRIRQTMPHVRFQLTGEFAEEHPNGVPREFVGRCVEEGLIEYLGYSNNVPALLGESTVVVLPSYYREGVPRVLLEAAACGRPVVTADTPGCRESVEHEVTGFLVPPRDATALADQTQRLLGDVELCRRMGSAGRLRVERQFDERIIAEQYLELYRQIGFDLPQEGLEEYFHAEVA
ncbi:MAG: glycosyltransferase family 4 protein [Bythopirellula sp.]